MLGKSVTTDGAVMRRGGVPLQNLVSGIITTADKIAPQVPLDYHTGTLPSVVWLYIEVFLYINTRIVGTTLVVNIRTVYALI